MRWHSIFPNEEAEPATMERLVLLNTRLLGIYLHRFPASQYGPIIAAHDHPWPFASIVLRGGYEETCCGEDWKSRESGSLGIRWARTVHKIRVRKGGALSLCVRGPKVQDWSWRRLPG